MRAVCWNRDIQAIAYLIPEPHPNIVIERVFPFVDLDHSLLADNRIEQREPSLISYESNLFVNARTNSIPGDMATHQPSTSRKNGEIANNPPVANAEIEAEIDLLRDTIGECACEASIQSRQGNIR